MGPLSAQNTMIPGEVSALLAGARAGDRDCQSRLFEVVYAELRRMAAAQLRNERADHTLQPTALVHEAYVRLLGRSDVAWENRAHFFTTAAGTMRRILVDHARARRAQKRDGALERVGLERAPLVLDDEDANRLLIVNDALDQLAQWDERQARVVELKFFGGLTVEEIAEALGISAKTVKRDWALARAWLLTRLEGEPHVR
jgi:RNA polymerase sigma-70 factor, ECF subfamily